MGWILGNTATVEATHTTATTADTTTVINNLDYGYYVVYPLGATDTSTAPGNETVKSVASLVSVTGTDATVNMKSNYPTVDKKLVSTQTPGNNSITVNGILNPSWESVHQGVLGEDDENAPEDTIAPHGAADEKKALAALDRVMEKWTAKYPNSMKRWKDNWDAISPIFKFSAAVRKVIYTTNAIESLNSTYRKLNRQRSVFPSDTALLKALYLATFEATKNGLQQSGTGLRFMES